MREINTIVVHCSATPPSMDIGVEEIRTWHVEENKWTDVGYHYVIRRDGVIEEGRPLKRPGAHVKGHNSDSIGICWVGGVSQVGNKAEDNRTADQSIALFHLIQNLQQEFQGAAVLGHRDFQGVTKACPSFDVRTWYAQQCNTKEKEVQAPDQKEKTVPLSTIFKYGWWIISTIWKIRRSIRRR